MAEAPNYERIDESVLRSIMERVSAAALRNDIFSYEQEKAALEQAMLAVSDASVRDKYEKLLKALATG